MPPAALPPSDGQHAPGGDEEELSPGKAHAQPARPSVADRSSVKPLSSQSLELKVTIERSTHEKLLYLQDLLSHLVPSGGLAQVLDRAFDLAIGQLEKRRFGATDRPLREPQPATSPRHIPTRVMREVWQRDQGRCTFVSEAGRRCPATRHIQFDHVLEVARGGEATVENLRLRCRPHNQHTAERTFGAEFMRQKRLAATEARAATKAQAAAADRDRAREAARAQAEAEEDPERSVLPWLRALGFTPREAREGAALCADMPDAPLEERVRFALSRLTGCGRRTSFGVAAT